MKKLLSLCTSLILLGGIAGCASTSSSGSANSNIDFGTINKVAVVSINGALDSEAAKYQITDIFNMELLRRTYSPVERQQVHALLQEQGFQNQTVTSSSNAAEIGRLLNVDAAIIVNIPKYKDEMAMTVKMVDVETGDILWVASGTAGTGAGLSQMAGVLTGAAVGGLGTEAATDDGTYGTIGAVAGAAAGKLAGQALSPQKEEQAQKLVAELMQSLPSR